MFRKLSILLFLSIVLSGCDVGIKEPTGNKDVDGKIAAEYLMKGDNDKYLEFIKKCNNLHYSKKDYSDWELKRYIDYYFSIMMTSKK